jgi:hypothetical protein
MPDEVRVYTVSGVPHAAFRPLTKPVMQLPGNQLGYGAFMRALLVALFEWVEVEPPIETTAYPVFVQATDADGNALGGIRHPLLEAPLATHVGWSLRASGYGEGELFTVQGLMIPFAQTEAERERARDPRPSLEARYASRDAWAARLAEAVDRLVAERCCWPRMATGWWRRHASRGTCTKRCRGIVNLTDPGRLLWPRSVRAEQHNRRAKDVPTRAAAPPTQRAYHGRLS